MRRYGEVARRGGGMSGVASDAMPRLHHDAAVLAVGGEDAGERGVGGGGVRVRVRVLRVVARAREGVHHGGGQERVASRVEMISSSRGRRRRRRGLVQRREDVRAVGGCSRSRSRGRPRRTLFARASSPPPPPPPRRRRRRRRRPIATALPRRRRRRETPRGDLGDLDDASPAVKTPPPRPSPSSPRGHARRAAAASGAIRASPFDGRLRGGD